MTNKTKLHEALDTLRAGRALISNPDKWTKNYLGYDPDTGHRWCDSESCAEAPKVCSWGAVSAVTNKSPYQLGYNSNHLNMDCAAAFLEEAAIETPDETGNPSGWTIITVNDEMGHEATLDMWDRAIIKAEKAVREYETGKAMEEDNHDRT